MHRMGPPPILQRRHAATATAPAGAPAAGRRRLPGGCPVARDLYPRRMAFGARIGTIPAEDGVDQGSRHLIRGTFEFPIGRARAASRLQEMGDIIVVLDRHTLHLHYQSRPVTSDALYARLSRRCFYINTMLLYRRARCSCRPWTPSGRCPARCSSHSSSSADLGFMANK